MVETIAAGERGAACPVAIRIVGRTRACTLKIAAAGDRRTAIDLLFAHRSNAFQALSTCSWEGIVGDHLVETVRTRRARRSRFPASVTTYPSSRRASRPARPARRSPIGGVLTRTAPQSDRGKDQQKTQPMSSPGHVHLPIEGCRSLQENAAAAARWPAREREVPPPAIRTMNPRALRRRCSRNDGSPEAREESGICNSDPLGV